MTKTNKFESLMNNLWLLLFFLPPLFEQPKVEAPLILTCAGLLIILEVL